MTKSLIITYISDELGDSGHESRCFLEDLGTEYIDEDDHLPAGAIAIDHSYSAYSRGYGAGVLRR